VSGRLRILFLTPGSGGGFYCENCLRDAVLLRTLHRRGHDAFMVPLYLPVWDEWGGAGGSSRVFFGGVKIYLTERFPFLKVFAPLLDKIADSPFVLALAARGARLTRPSELGPTTCSMLRGEEGRQAEEIDRLAAYLKSTGRPDVVILSNALLAGLARKLKAELSVPVVCQLQGEHTFLDELRSPYREEAWNLLKGRLADIDMLIAASRFYRDYMAGRLGVPAERIEVLYNGIDLEPYPVSGKPPDRPTVGYLSRLYPGGGLDLLVEAFLRLRREEGLGHVQLLAAGGHTAEDRAFLRSLRRRIRRSGAADAVRFLPNLEGERRRAFLQEISVLSVPALNEAFGYFVLEALAVGRPVVLPRSGAFTEIVEATGGGLLCRPGDPEALAASLKRLLSDREECRRLGLAGRRAVEKRFQVNQAAGNLVQLLKKVLCVAGTGGVGPADSVSE